MQGSDAVPACDGEKYSAPQAPLLNGRWSDAGRPARRGSYHASGRDFKLDSQSLSVDLSRATTSDS